MYIVRGNVQCTLSGDMYNLHSVGACTMYIVWGHV